MMIGTNQKYINAGTLNCRGLNRNNAENSLANDMYNYKVHILAIQETHLKGTGTKEILTSDGKQKYDFFLLWRGE